MADNLVGSLASKDLEESTMKRVTGRLLPFICLMYTLCIIDRVNVGSASLALTKGLGYTDAQFGFGAGVFFLGYFIFEVPSNILLDKFGARRWMSRIMITWGILATCMMFITRNPNTFYGMRFLLGLAEAGFFPGMIVYLTYWFPSRERARATGKFIIATTLANVIGGPLGAELIKLDGTWGLAGWQWLFMLEGIPTILVGFLALRFLTDKPETATWLPENEKQWLIAEIAKEQAARPKHVSLIAALSEKKVLHLCAVFFLWQVVNNGISFFMPKLMHSRTDWSNSTILWLSAIPAIVGSIALLVAAHFSDKTRERQKFVMGGMAAYAICVILIAYAPIPGLLLLAYCAKDIALNTSNAPFWSVATGFLSGTAAAGGIAFINSVGNLGGFFGPWMVGKAYEQTHSYNSGLFILCGCMAMAALLASFIKHDKKMEHGEA